MPNEASMTRLLYAILSQKCLKDIDWNKVAQDPILSQEITNGHAARMRYSRFKKQMEGTPTIPRGTRVPKRQRPMKVEKRSQMKREPGRRESRPGHQMRRPIKHESDLGLSYHVPGSASHMQRGSPAPQAQMMQRRVMMSPTSSPSPAPGPMMTTALAAVKREPRTTNQSPQTPTPNSTPTFPNTPMSMSSSFPLRSTPPQLHTHNHTPSQSQSQSQSQTQQQPIPLPSFTYPSPPPNHLNNMEEVYGLSPFGMSNMPMSPFNISFGMDGHSERGSAERGTSSERERSLFQQSMTAARLLGERESYEMGYPWVGASGLGSEWGGSQERLSVGVGSQSQSQSQSQGLEKEMGRSAQGSEKRVGGEVQDGTEKGKEPEVTAAEMQKAPVKTEEKWEQGYRRE